MPKLTDSIQFLKGVGEKRAALYHKLGVDEICSLLRFFPRTYVDYSAVTPLSEAVIGETACVEVRIFRKGPEQRIRKGLSIFRAYATDDTADLTITIYNNKYQFAALQVDHTYRLYGTMKGTLLRKELQSPQILDPAEEEGAIVPVYPQTNGLSSKTIAKNVRQALTLYGDRLEEVLPDKLRREERLCHMRYAYENIHFPKDAHALAVARKRLVFEELLTLQLGLFLLRGRSREATAVVLQTCDLTPFLQALPFTLTEGQREAIADGMRDLQSGVPMNRLVQGDVGSGKTMVACALAYLLAKDGYQTAVMAPTEILARQHAETFRRLLEPLGISVALVVGSATAKQKRLLREELAAGTVQVAIGTHALLSEGVDFQNLGLVVTDEQHRFGVRQRADLADKGAHVHKLVMSATPIPRTLALMIYGELDVSAIRQMPSGRKPVETYLISGNKRERAYHFIREHLDRGLQAYIVCPLIEENDGLEQKLFSVEEYLEKLKQTELGSARIGMLHGRMKAAEKEAVMQAFQAHTLDLLVSTTVIEVGVDVPNAVVMLIENAERFGLSQLHQLRGRVGRGTEQSTCILVSDNRTPETRERMKILTRTTDGFALAEEDLKLRGPGDFFGNRQHGLPMLQIASMADDMAVLSRAQAAAKALLAEDPALEREEHAPLRRAVEQLFADAGTT